jgi:hypothetical protein
MDLGGMEAEIRSLPGVIACTVADRLVTVLIDESADEHHVRALASALVGAHGEVRVLAAPGVSPNVRIRSGIGSFVAVGILAVLLVGALAILPLGKARGPRRVPPAALGPSFAPEPSAPHNPPVRLSEPVPNLTPPRSSPGHGVVFVVKAPAPAPPPSVPRTAPPPGSGSGEGEPGGAPGDGGEPSVRGLRLAKGHFKRLPGHGYGSKWDNHFWFTRRDQ